MSSVSHSSSAPSSEPSSLSPADIRSVVTGLMLAILLGALDQTIVSVSLPKMAADLGGVSLLAWVVSGYLIAMAVATPIYGKLGDIYGRRVVLSSAIVLFLIASVACALATTMPMLVAARILQGLGGGGLISVAQATIADVVAPRDRGRYQAYISGAFAIASVSGPVLGGLLTTYLSWRWVFWINLPLGLPALLISRRALAKLNKPSIRREVDYLGAGLLTAGLTALLLTITRIGQGIPFMHTSNLWMLAITIIALGLFTRNALRTAEPIIPLGLFRIRTVAISCLVLFIAFIQLVGLTVLIPLELQMLTSLGPDGAALQLIPLSLGVPVGAYIGGRLMTHLGTFKNIQLTGALIIPAAVFGVSLVHPASLLALTACLAAAGIGIGLQLPTTIVAVQDAVPHRHVGVATGVSAFFRALGAAIGIALLMAFLMMSLRSGVSTTDVVLSGAEMIDMLIGNQPLDHGLISRSALSLTAETAFQSVYRFAALIAVSSVLLTLFLKDVRLSEKKPPTAVTD